MSSAASARKPILVPASVGLPPTLLRIGRARLTGGGTHRYLNESFAALHLYYAAAVCTIGSERFTIAPGSITVTPRAAESIYETEADLGHVFVHFTLDSAPDTPTRMLPLHVPPRSRSEPIAATIVAALTAFRTDRLYARVKLWEALVLLVRLAGPDGGRGRPRAPHPAVEHALTWIDLHLPEPCTLESLAEEAGVSATHLNRLFADALGVSAMRYLRNRRMELAHYLLVTTGLTVKDVAYQVGIPDLHAFNKLCKAYFGSPPKAIRRG
jgi:AraC-like DNA-binding protein